MQHEKISMENKTESKKLGDKGSFGREIILSVITLVLSVIVNMVIPLNFNIFNIGGQRSAAEEFFQKLDSTSLTEVYAAARYVSIGSDAATYADIVARLWRAEYDRRGVPQGTVIDAPRGSVVEQKMWPWEAPLLQLCYPKISNLPYGKCVHVGDFSFDGNGKISGFSVNGVPVSRLLLHPDWSSSKSNIVIQDGDVDLTAYFGGAIVDPDFSHASIAAILYPSDSNRQKDILIDENDIIMSDRDNKHVNGSVSIPWKISNYSHVMMSARFPTSGEGFIRLHTKLVKWGDDLRYDQVQSTTPNSDWINLNHVKF